jgi:hypothetical protein
MLANIFKKRYKKSIILPCLIPFYIKGFYNNEIQGKTLALEEIDCNDWFVQFKNIILSSKDSFFPICRLSDGEYTFLCGNQPPIKSFFISQFLSSIKFFINNIIPPSKFKAGEIGIYNSGEYNKEEISKFNPKYLNQLRQISETGILALHLTYTKKPFQERFHYALKKIFDNNCIEINKKNYYPFYFVYAFFQTNEFRDFVNKKNILFISGSNNSKNEIIKNHFINLNASNVEFYNISTNKSLLDKVNLEKIQSKKIDICFVAAGIGKPNIIVQLKPLNCICIDVGYMFEVWANPNLGIKRPWCSIN